jgi:hypothetical protein
LYSESITHHAAFDDDNHSTSQNDGGSTTPGRFEVKQPPIKSIAIEDASPSSTFFKLLGKGRKMATR